MDRQTDGWLSAGVQWGAGDLPGRAPEQGFPLQLLVRERAESSWTGWARGGCREGLGKAHMQREARGDRCPWSILSCGTTWF